MTHALQHWALHTGLHTTHKRRQLYGYFGGLHRYGGMATAVLDTSNAFLHLAKAFHAPGLPALRAPSEVLFKVFALVFLVGEGPAWARAWGRPLCF